MPATMATKPAQPPRTPFLALTGYSLMLLGLSVIPPVGLVIRHARFLLKLHHIGAFALYVVLAWWFFGYTSVGRRPWRRLGAACVLTFLYGALIEMIQLLFSHRSGRAADVVQNGIGIAIGAAAVVLWLALTSRRAGARMRERRTA